MNITDVYKISEEMKIEEKQYWKDKLLSTMKDYSCSASMNFEILFVSVYLYSQNRILKRQEEVIAYGAGNMAKSYLPEVRKNAGVSVIWDAYSDQETLCGVPIEKPFTTELNRKAPVIIFVDNEAVREEISVRLTENGYTNIWYFRDFLSVVERIEEVEQIQRCITDETKNIYENLMAEYEIVRSDKPAVLYSVLPIKWSNVPLENMRKVQACVLKEKLEEQILFKECEIDSAIQKYLGQSFETLFDFIQSLELFLREVLIHGTKTKKRPIRMHGDAPYDKFAIFTTVQIILEYVFQEDKRIILERLKNASGMLARTVAGNSVYCYYLLSCGELQEALECARAGVRKEPNDLLASETFYQVAVECTKNGLEVDEPLPTYDLKERFCWSGLTFALCQGFDKESGKPDFLPCFRTLQCAAYPRGAFESGEEWKEFRRSILDGSFKYCQKNQCANLIGGWLPKKDGCAHEVINHLLESDNMTVIPPEELHFSYDHHCNLICPSCRLERCTNTKEENERLDNLYKTGLLPLVKKAKHLCLSGCGEALLSSHSKKILQSLSPEKYPSLAVELRTNVTSVSETNWNSLGEGRKNIRHVAASIDSCSKQLFEKLRFPAKWEVVLKNLEFLQSLRNSGEIDLLEFHVVVQKDNMEELVDIIKMAAKYDADVVTFSRLVNWRGMSEEEYCEVNPFWQQHPLHERMQQIVKEVEEIRRQIEEGICEFVKGQKMYINMHFLSDPEDTYDEIRTGRLKIR